MFFFFWLGIVVLVDYFYVVWMSLVIFFIHLNFWDEAWFAIFYVLFFGLLSSSLLLLIVTQRFGCCTLQSSSGVLCLSEYRNDSTWEIIFKVWLLIKQSIQEIWRCCSKNDIIVFIWLIGVEKQWRHHFFLQIVSSGFFSCHQSYRIKIIYIYI